MSKPRRTPHQEFYNFFSDMTPEQQDGTLITLGEIHRQAVRQAKRRPPASEPGSQSEGTRKPAQSELEQPHPAAQHYRDLETTGEPHE